MVDIISIYNLIESIFKLDYRDNIYEIGEFGKVYKLTNLIIIENILKNKKK